MSRSIDLSSYSSEPIEIELDGRTWRGIRFFSGRAQVRQEVHFEDLLRVDPKAHARRDVAQMRLAARALLRGLVEAWREQERTRPVKVTPRAKRSPQRRIR
jgi:hypothetical protein